MKKTVTLALFTDTLFDLNGVSRFIQDLAQESQQRHKPFMAVTSSPINPPLSIPTIGTVDYWFKMRMPYYPDQYLALPSLVKLKKKLQELDPDVVHISTPGPVGWNTMRYAKRYGYPITSTYHTDFPGYIYDLTHSKILKKLTVKLMHSFYKEAEFVFTRSLEYADILENEIGIPRDKVVYLHPGINTANFHPGFKDETLWSRYEGIDQMSVKMLYVGRLCEEKNFPMLLELFETFQTERKDDRPKVELIVIGEGSYLKEKNTWAHKGVHLLGPKHKDELSAIYASSDFFIFPSLTDTLGQVVMEAQSSGLPVLVSNKGGPQSIVRQSDYKSGLVLPGDDRRAWLDAMHRLSDDTSLRASMGEAALAMMRGNHFSKSFEEFWEVHEARFGKRWEA